jgi:hypothetical protein
MGSAISESCGRWIRRRLAKRPLERSIFSLQPSRVRSSASVERRSPCHPFRRVGDVVCKMPAIRHAIAVHFPAADPGCGAAAVAIDLAKIIEQCDHPRDRGRLTLVRSTRQQKAGLFDHLRSGYRGAVRRQIAFTGEYERLAIRNAPRARLDAIFRRMIKLLK